MRRPSPILIALALASCGAAPAPVPIPAPSSAPVAAPEGAPITAKTAFLLLTASEEGKAPEGDAWRISAVMSGAGAARGFSGAWEFDLVSVNENLLVRFRVSTPDTVEKRGEEPFNPVFKTQGPPFLLDEWKLDSSDAARLLPEGDVPDTMFLEAGDDGELRWSVTLEDASRTSIVAGRASTETPPPPDDKIRYPRR